MLKHIAVHFLCFSLILQPVAALANEAVTHPVEVWPKSAPTLGATANGTRQIDITAPNAAGVSTNKFKSYNVSPNGVVINNSVVNTTSSIGGLVTANANLAGNAADKVIFEVVNSTAVSKLDGATEMAGKAADFVLINPHGIACRGCSFVNTSRVELSAEQNRAVAPGSVVTIEAPVAGSPGFAEAVGLVASDEVREVILRAAKVGVFAPTKVVGVFKAEALGLGLEPGDVALQIEAPIDAGAMYLIATKSGVGVNLGEDDLLARGGDIEILGDVVDITGNVVAAENVVIEAETSLTQDGAIVAGKVARLEAATANITGGVYGREAVHIDVAGTLTTTPRPSLQPLPVLEDIPLPPLSVLAKGLVGETVTITAGVLDNRAGAEVDAVSASLEVGTLLGDDPRGDDVSDAPIPKLSAVDENTQYVVAAWNEDSPDVSRGDNGVRIVEINAPTSNGRSVNKFRTFNVSPNGTILNNSLDGATTYLADNITGNQNFIGDTASHIVIEALGSNQIARLDGVVEIAGDRADMTIVSRGGVACTNCGYINTANLALGARLGSNVTDALVTIGSDLDENGRFRGWGLDGTILDSLTIVGGGVNIGAPVAVNGPLSVESRAVAGGIYADYGITGSNFGVVQADSMTLNSDRGVNLSGGMLLAESGDMDVVGQSVRLNGTFVAAGDMSVEADKALTISGQTVAQRNISLQGHVVNAVGAFTAGEDFAITANGSIALKKRGDVDSGVFARDIVITSRNSNVNNSLDWVASRDVTLSAGRNVNQFSTTVFAGGAYSSAARNVLMLDNSSVQGSNGLSMTSDHLIVSRGSLLSNGENSSTDFAIKRTFRVLNGSVVAVHGPLSVSTEKYIEVSGGAITTQGDMTLVSKDMVHDHSTLMSLGVLRVEATNDVVSRFGTFQAGEGLYALAGNDLTTIGAYFLSQGNAQLTTGNDMTLLETRLEVGRINAESYAVGDAYINAGGAVNFVGSSLFNLGDALITGEMVTLESATMAGTRLLQMDALHGSMSLSNTHVEVRHLNMSSGANMTILGGGLAAIGSFSAETTDDLFVTDSTLLAAGDMALMSRAGDATFVGATVEAAGSLGVQAEHTINLAFSSVEAGDVLVFLARLGDIVNSDSLLTATTIDLTAEDNIINQGTLLASEALLLAANVVDNQEDILSNYLSMVVESLTNSGAILADNLELVATHDVTNEGLFYTSETLDGIVKGTFTNAGPDSIIESDAILSLNAGTLINQGAMTAPVQLLAAQNTLTNRGTMTATSLEITTGHFNNYGAMSTSQSLLTRAKGNILNDGTLLSEQTLTLAAVGDITNSGPIAGDQVAILGTNITNHRPISGTDIWVTADETFTNTANVEANDFLSVIATNLVNDGVLGSNRHSDITVENTLSGGGTLKGLEALALTLLDEDERSKRTIQVTVSGSAFEGVPQFYLQVDGQKFGKDIPVAASHQDGERQIFTFFVPELSDTSTVDVRFFNDLAGAEGDRNLYVESIAVGHTLINPDQATYIRSGESYPGQAAMPGNGYLRFDLSEQDELAYLAEAYTETPRTFTLASDNGQTRLYQDDSSIGQRLVMQENLYLRTDNLHNAASLNLAGDLGLQLTNTFLNTGNLRVAGDMGLNDASNDNDSALLFTNIGSLNVAGTLAFDGETYRNDGEMITGNLLVGAGENSYFNTGTLIINGDHTITTSGLAENTGRLDISGKLTINADEFINRTIWQRDSYTVLAPDMNPVTKTWAKHIRGARDNVFWRGGSWWKTDNGGLPLPQDIDYYMMSYKPRYYSSTHNFDFDAIDPRTGTWLKMPFDVVSMSFSEFNHRYHATGMYKNHSDAWWIPDHYYEDMWAEYERRRQYTQADRRVSESGEIDVGNLVINSSGAIRNLGGASIITSGDMTLNAGTNITSEQELIYLHSGVNNGVYAFAPGTMQAGGDITFNASTGGIAMDGFQMVADGDITFVADQDIILESKIGDYAILDYAADGRTHVFYFPHLQSSLTSTNGNVINNSVSGDIHHGGMTIDAANDILFNAPDANGDINQYALESYPVYRLETEILENLTLAGNNAAYSAGGNITLKGASVGANGTLDMHAGGNIVIEGMLNSWIAKEEFGKNHHLLLRSIKDTPAELVAGEDIFLTAGNAITIAGGSLDAGRDVALVAGGDINLTAMTEVVQNYYKKKKSGFFSSSSYERGWTTSKTLLPSLQAGQDITVNSGGDITGEGAQVKAGRDIQLNAAGDISFTGAQVEHYDWTVQKSSGFDLFGLYGILFDNKDPVDSIPLLSNIKQVSETKGGLDLAPIANLGIEIFQSYEKFNNLKAQGQNAGLGLVESQLGVEVVNGFIPLPSSIGFTSTTVKTRSEWVDTYKSVLQAGNDIIASGDNIYLKGTDLIAERDVRLQAINDIIVESIKEDYSFTQDVESDSFALSYGLTELGSPPSISLSYNAHQQNYEGQGTTYNPSQIFANNQFVVSTGGAFNLIGSTILADDIDIDSATTQIVTQQDTYNATLDGSGYGFGVTFAGGTVIPSFSLNGLNGDEDKRWSTIQASLIGRSRVEIDTDHLDNVGGLIANIDDNGVDQGNLVINADTLTFRNLADVDKSETTSWGFDTNGFVNVATDGTFRAGFDDSSAVLGVAQFAHEYTDKRGTTKATIGQGTINTASDIARLNRDVSVSQIVLKDEDGTVSVAVPIITPKDLSPKQEEQLAKEVTESIAAVEDVKAAELATQQAAIASDGTPPTPDETAFLKKQELLQNSPVSDVKIIKEDFGTFSDGAQTQIIAEQGFAGLNTNGMSVIVHTQTTPDFETGEVITSNYLTFVDSSGNQVGSPMKVDTATLNGTFAGQQAEHTRSVLGSFTHQFKENVKQAAYGAADASELLVNGVIVGGNFVITHVQVPLLEAANAVLPEAIIVQGGQALNYAGEQVEILGDVVTEAGNDLQEFLVSNTGGEEAWAEREEQYNEFYNDNIDARFVEGGLALVPGTALLGKAAKGHNAVEVVNEGVDGLSNSTFLVNIKRTLADDTGAVDVGFDRKAAIGEIKPQSLNNEDARIWYHQQLDKIPGEVNQILPLREQAFQAMTLRNEAKLAARDLMSDQDLAKTLPPPDNLNSLVKKAYNRGLRGDDIWKSIIDGSQRSNPTVDDILGVSR